MNRRWTFNRMWKALQRRWFPQTRPCINCEQKLLFQNGDWVTGHTGPNANKCPSGTQHRI